MKRIMISFFVVLFLTGITGCGALIPKSTLNKMGGQKDWLDIGSGKIYVKVINSQGFKITTGNTCKLTFQVDNKTNSTFQMLALNFQVIGKDKTSFSMSAVVQELKMGQTQTVEVLFPNNVECQMVAHLKFNNITMSSVRGENMIPIYVFNVEKSLEFSNSALEIKK
jgi:outer membrane lipopolysaccharide assembly protein LptE/RlpB